RLLRRLLAPRSPLLLYSAQNIEKRYPWPFRSLERAALQTADAVYVCNEEAGDILRRKGFGGLVRVLPLGVDVARFVPGHPGGPPPLRIGFVGRLVPEKGVQVILDAMKNEDDWYLEVVGAGPHRTWLTEWTRELGLTDRVSFRGHASNDELPELYRQFHVVVVPSLPTPSWREQFGSV